MPMSYKYALLFVFMMFIAPVTVSAQQNTQASKPTTSPIFIAPYKPTLPTYASGLPSVVKNTGRGSTRQTTGQIGTARGPQYDGHFNPYQGINRITVEQDFYDQQTKRYYGQYEYFALLAKRGDKQGLLSAVKKVQTNGVFDPAKYQAAVQGGLNQTNTTTNKPTTTPVRRVTNNKKQTAPQNALTTPKKVHQGYDDEMQMPAKPAKNSPIFLR